MILLWGRDAILRGVANAACHNSCVNFQKIDAARSVPERGESMFEQTMLIDANAGRRAWTTGLGFAGEAALVAAALLAPIIWPQTLPKPQALLMLLTPPPPSPPPAMWR